MTFKKRVEATSKKAHRHFAVGLAVLFAVCMMFVGAVGAEGAVAKVGDTEYATIDEAINNWGNNQELTLLADVTLSDTITLKSTEHHILNLGTYTMTAASKKDAIVIKACGTGDAERSALTINADGTNPGGINAGNKRIIYYKYTDGGISTNDRPIIKINGGVFTGATSSFGTCGIQTIGTAARKCATVNIAGGTFDCSINGQTKSKLIISGGTFNYSVGSQGDSTCSRLISGGKFKSFGFMTADDDNTKFWIGIKMATSNVGVYVDDNGYLVVGGNVITEPGEMFEAHTTDYKERWSTYLKYSSAKDNGLYYTNVNTLITKLNGKLNSDEKVTLDITDSEDTLSGKTIKLGSGDSKLTIIYNPTDDSGWTVQSSEGKVIEKPYSETSSNGVNISVYINQYDVNFEAYTDEPSTINLQKIWHNEKITKPTVELTKTGYVFDDWYSNSELTTKYDFEEAVTKSLTLYAKWNPNNYTVVFNGNGGDGVMSDQEFDYDDEHVLSKNTFTRIGYTFARWNNKSDGTGTNYEDESSENLTDEDDKTVILYAQWTPNTYTVSFNANGGTGDMNSQQFTYDTEPTELTSNAFTKTGYTFAGWAESSDGDVKYVDGAQVQNLTTEKDETVTLFANWTANTYTVKFDPNGGSGCMENQKFVYDEEKPLTVNAFTRTGYTFAGWNTATDGSGTSYNDKASAKNLTAVDDDTVTLFAQWKKIENPPTPNNKPNVVNPPAKTTYQVTFSPNGGSGSMDVQKFNEGESKQLTVNDFVRDGYEFKGWAVTPSGDVVFGDGESVVIDKTITLYAVWEEIPETPIEEPEEPTDKPKTQFSQMIIPGLFLIILIALILAAVARIVIRRRK